MYCVYKVYKEMQFVNRTLLLYLDNTHITRINPCFIFGCY